MNQTRIEPYIEIDGAAVRYHRIYTAGLTVAALAEKSGVSERYVYKIESGQQCVGPSVFKRLREALQAEDVNVLLAQPVEYTKSA
jgi:predicted transcriptional regulator